MPSVTTTKMRQLGRSYAQRAVPLVKEKADEQGVRLPVKHAELFTLLQSIYAVMEQEHSVSWDHLTTKYQDAFLHSFWSTMVRERVALPVPG